MEETSADPRTLTKNSGTVRAAIDDIARIDILVCGKCHQVYHFIESFKRHKVYGTCANPQLVGDQVAQVKKRGTVRHMWAYLLWKNAHHPKSDLSFWALYQKWCKLSADVKKAWIAAGRTVQGFTSLSEEKLRACEEEASPIDSDEKMGLVSPDKATNDDIPKREKVGHQPLLHRVVQNLKMQKNGRRNTRPKTGSITVSPEFMADGSPILSPSSGSDSSPQSSPVKCLPSPHLTRVATSTPQDKAPVVPFSSNMGSLSKNVPSEHNSPSSSSLKEVQPYISQQSSNKVTSNSNVDVDGISLLSASLEEMLTKEDGVTSNLPEPDTHATAVEECMPEEHHLNDEEQVAPSEDAVKQLSISADMATDNTVTTDAEVLDQDYVVQVPDDSIDIIDIKEENLSETESMEADPCEDDDMLDLQSSTDIEPDHSGNILKQECSNNLMEQIVHSSPPPLLKPSIPSLDAMQRMARRSIKDAPKPSSEDEYVVEKILAKRFNPRKKRFEYLLKWEGYPNEQNTWEPVRNMETCSELVESFERNLARQKAAHELPKRQSTPKALTKVQKTQMKNVPSLSDASTASGRPVRTSKKKALVQVRTWCGSMVKRTDSEGGKRKLSDSSDSDLLGDKKRKHDADDDWSSGGMVPSPSGSSSIEDKIDRRRHPILSLIREEPEADSSLKNKEQTTVPLLKRPPGRPRKLPLKDPKSAKNVNGATPSKKCKIEEKTLSGQIGFESGSSENRSTGKTLQPPVLVANSKGVVKVDPRQLPNLTSGVYIVANKSNKGEPHITPAKGKMVTVKEVAESRTDPRSQSGEQSCRSNESTSGLTRIDVETDSCKLTKSGSPLISAASGTTQLKPLLIRPGLQSKTPKLTSPRTLAHPEILTSRSKHPGSRPLIRPHLMSSRSVPVTVRPRSYPLSLRPAGVRSLGVSPARGVFPRPRSLNTSLPTPGSRHRVVYPYSPHSDSSTSPKTMRSLLTSHTVHPYGAQHELGAKFPSSDSDVKKSIAIPGIQTKITSAVKPRPSSENKMMSALTAQAKSGMKPIHALLGKAVSSQPPMSSLLASKRITKEQRMSFISASQKQKLKMDGERHRRGRGHVTAGSQIREIELKRSDTKLLDGDGIHMEFQHVSDSESDGEMSDFPMGDLPPIEPASPPRPFTLCPITGKILGKAEGEHTPLPSPEPTPPEEESIPLEGDLEQHTASAVPEAEGEETLLKVEMSPGGTTSKVVEGSVEDELYVDTLRTEQGLTVTKIADSDKSAGDLVSDVHVISNAVKGAGGISVPATKLIIDPGDMNSDLVTDSDGVVYQISTDGHEVLEGTEGMQQCVYVTTEQMEGDDQGAVLTLDTAVAEAVAQMTPERMSLSLSERTGCSQFFVKETETSNELVMATVVDATDAEGNPETELVTHVVRQGDLITEAGASFTCLALNQLHSSASVQGVVLHTGDGNSELTSQDAATSEEAKEAHIVVGDDINPETELGLVVPSEEGYAVDDGSQTQVVYQILQEEEDIPGSGKRRVVLLLPNGHLMVTDVEEPGGNDTELNPDD